MLSFAYFSKSGASEGVEEQPDIIKTAKADKRHNNFFILRSPFLVCYMSILAYIHVFVKCFSLTKKDNSNIIVVFAKAKHTY